MRRSFKGTEKEGQEMVFLFWHRNPPWRGRSGRNPPVWSSNGVSNGRNPGSGAGRGAQMGFAWLIFLRRCQHFDQDSGRSLALFFAKKGKRAKGLGGPSL